MATVNEDGSPHNTPFFFIHDESLAYIYWCSHPESQHSKNVTRTGKVFVVLYESTTGGGFYIDASHAHELEGVELERALKIHNGMRSREGKDELSSENYMGNSVQRMYAAKPNHFYVNYNQRDIQGKIIKDIRHEISMDQLY